MFMLIPLQRFMTIFFSVLEPSTLFNIILDLLKKICSLWNMENMQTFGIIFYSKTNEEFCYGI